jgi:RNA polymerase sigma-70 factor (ECF subfamily)
LDPALVALFRQHYSLIRAKCARILHDPQEAEDVAQETFLRLCRGDVRHDDARARLAWIYRTSTNLAIDVWRRRRARGERTDERENVMSVPGPHGALVARHSLRTLADRIPAAELELAILSRFDGLTHPEIAEVTGRSERTVRRLLGRLDERLARLQKEIAP